MHIVTRGRPKGPPSERKHLMSVMLEGYQREIIEELSEIQGKSKGAVVRELLDSALEKIELKRK